MLTQQVEIGSLLRGQFSFCNTLSLRDAVHVFIQLDQFNPWLFLRDDRASGKYINKEYDDITKVRRNNF